MPSSPSLKTASSTCESASTQRSTPKTSASFQTGLFVCRFVVVFLRFRLTVDVGLPLPLPIVTVTRTSGPAYRVHMHVVLNRSIFLKAQAVKNSGPLFGPRCCILVSNSSQYKVNSVIFLNLLQTPCRICKKGLICLFM